MIWAQYMRCKARAVVNLLKMVEEECSLEEINTANMTAEMRPTGHRQFSWQIGWGPVETASQCALFLVPSLVTVGLLRIPSLHPRRKGSGNLVRRTF